VVFETAGRQALNKVVVNTKNIIQKHSDFERF